MFKTCRWCNKDLGELPPLEDKRTTHGMCSDCAKQFQEQIEHEKLVERCKQERRK